MSTTTQTAEDLRTWARGIYPTEAAVELLIRYQDGRHAAAGNPWIVGRGEERHGNMSTQWHWLDVHRLSEQVTSGQLSGGERRLLSVAASLAGGEPIDLSDTITGLGRDALDLVLAAIAHAGGSHEHRVMTQRPFTTESTGEEIQIEWPGPDRAGSLHPWPGGSA